jgi:hypothetical protein
MTVQLEHPQLSIPNLETPLLDLGLKNSTNLMNSAGLRFLRPFFLVFVIKQIKPMEFCHGRWMQDAAYCKDTP